MLDVAELIRRITTGRGEDPALALATAKVESGFRVDARGDPIPDARAVGGYCSFGLFQENVCGGAGTGFALADLFDPAGATSRFSDRVQRVRATGFVGTPGQIAAAAQRPADPFGYAAKVDELYGAFASSSSSPSSGTAPAGASACEGVDAATVTRIRTYMGNLLAHGTASSRDPVNVAASLRSAFPNVSAACLQSIAYGSADAIGAGPDQQLARALSPESIGAAVGEAAQNTLVVAAIAGTILVLGYTGIRRAVA